MSHTIAESVFGAAGRHAVAFIGIAPHARDDASRSAGAVRTALTQGNNRFRHTYHSAFRVGVQGPRPKTERNVPSARRVRASPLALSLADARKRTGLKATLQRRLHGLLVQAAIEARDEEEESDSDGDGGAAGAASPPRGPARRVRARRS